MSKINYDPGIDKISKPEEQARFISQNFDQIKRCINNGQSFADNFDAKILTLTFSATNSDTSLAHGLERVPAGYLVLKRSASMIVYDGASANTSDKIFLRSSATGSVTVLVF